MLTSSISIISLILMTVSAVDNIRNLSSIALFGKQIPFFYIFASLFFFIPCALVSAQLSSLPGNENGIYHWVKRAFGPRVGFTAVWLQWTENLFWYPTLLTFIVGTLGHWISPELSLQSNYLLTSSLVCFYGISLLNLYGLKLSAIVSNLCAVFGLILPMFLIIGLGAHWYLSGKPLSNTITHTAFIPNLFDFNVWVALTSVIMSLCGIEITTAHVKRISHPQKNYPRALLISTFIILVTLILASLSIAAVVPSNELSFVSGIVQSLEVFLKENGLLGLLKYFVFAAVIGSLGTLNNWLIAPIQGLQEAAKEGLLPKVLNTTNQQGVPVSFLLIQMVVVTLLVILFSFFPTVNSAYWFMTVIASQLYMIMYLLMFFAFIKLKNESHYTFKIPGGNKIHLIIAGLGIFGCFMTILVGFIPLQDNLNPGYYGLTIFGILAFLLLIPQILCFKKRDRVIQEEKPVSLKTLSYYDTSDTFGV